jgi:uncharacterized protein (TIGR02246 family)
MGRRGQGRAAQAGSPLSPDCAMCFNQFTAEKRHARNREDAMKLAYTAAALVFIACPAMAQSVKASIDQANQSFMSAFARGDAAGIAALYTAQATVLPPGGPMMKGRKDIEAFWKQAMTGLKNLKLQAVDVQSFGTGAAREIGTFTAEAGQQPVVGKYVVIWRKEGKSWHLATDIWNTDK